MTKPKQTPLVIGGWTIFAHPLFLDQLSELTAKVEKQKAKDSGGYHKKNSAKRLAAIEKIVTEVIPAAPGSPDHMQGDTLGAENKHWFRVKFFQQYRLFYRFNSKAKVIVLGWVNDEGTKRAYDSKTDAYRVFARMLDSGNPPGNWEDLLGEAEQAEAGLGAAMKRV
ncbi:type II toxin-antitoxin system YhaV family toxin [Henriciella aquimarina]|uniref:type II toxin-antitoxin system YhaV family toxin n=1 Tax=Henriciella aquimarina TaxID=545261 RepID=UPI0009FD461C|nr:type II toxin-antitoxin system YhaV family toxin [Henriciella aquimarina]